ncbi:MAG: DUF1330 domain-containing protein [Polyangiales bacterium]
MSSDGPVEILVGVNVVDPEGYARYRAEMTPLLEAHGGRFVVDVQVAKVLRSPEETPFNRMFTIRFESEAQLDRYFELDAYRAIRKRHFEPSVSATVWLGRYRLGA